MRLAVVALVCAGCDVSFGLVHFDRVDEAVVDGSKLDAPVNPGTAGCADGTREGFEDEAKYPTIAACSGGWSDDGGVGSQPTTDCVTPGNTSANPTGNGCAAANLCEAGWVVCRDSGEVGSRLVADETCDHAIGTLGFFATQQQSGGNQSCASIGNDDLFGCGTLGVSPNSNCAALTRTSGDGCAELGNAWLCTDHVAERITVRKLRPDGGGVLCCR